MHPEEIKAALRIAKITPAMLADELQVAPSSISQTISGRIRSERIQRRISQILGKSISAIWPDQVTLRRSRSQIEAQRRSVRRSAP
ncbi:helix-turn-helix domain-containing protein [Bordetella ansorpii]|uniref:helix-turn-helix domain-containing protein n=1 Tax=Bordetella ansorpii TaxID=288768 RepID=UPI0009ECCDD6|nr:helix-turn-helix domain-containing protein [Bordetella ansorpii]